MSDESKTREWGSWSSRLVAHLVVAVAIVVADLDRAICWGFGYSMIRAGEAITAAQDDIAYQAIVLGQTSLVDFTPTSDPRADFGYISMTYKF